MSCLLYPFREFDRTVDQICAEARIGTCYEKPHKASRFTGIAKARRAKRQRRKQK